MDQNIQTLQPLRTNTLRRARVLSLPGERKKEVPPDPQNCRFEDSGKTVHSGDQQSQSLKDSHDLIYQVPYKPGSELPSSGALIATALSASARAAIEEFIDEEGPIDQYNSDALGRDVSILGRYLTAEQSDAAALAIRTIKRGEEIIINDATGFGKGRPIIVAAGAAIRSGYKVIILTEKPNLFSDLWRDIEDVDLAEIIGEPIIMNSDAKGRIVDLKSRNTKDKLKVLFKHDKKLAEEIYKTGRWPEGRNLMMATYSQINRKQNAKVDALINLAKNAVLICDESHNTVKDSAIGKNTQISKSVAQATINASATHGRNINDMLAYANVMPWLHVIQNFSGYDFSKLNSENRKAFAEASAIRAVRNGNMIGRQHDMRGLKMSIIDIAERIPNLAEYEERFSDAARTIRDIWHSAQIIANSGDRLPTKLNAMDWKPMNFGTAFSMAAQHFSLAVKLDIAVDEAIAAMSDGKRYFGALRSTKGTTLKLIADHARQKQGETDDIFGGFQGTMYPKFKDVLRLVGHKMTRLSARSGRETKVIWLKQKEIVAQLERLDKMLEDFPDLPVSPLDYLKFNIEAKAAALHGGKCPSHMRVGEISGRTIGLDENGMIVSFTPPDRNEVIFGFNNGGINEVGAIYSTKAGAVGLSAHDSANFSHHAQRVFQELEGLDNVIERAQLWGRVARRGQLTVPKFYMFGSSMPGDLYVMASQAKKVAELSAVVAGSSESMRMVANIPDPIDRAGDQAAKALLNDNPALRKTLMVSVEDEDDTTDEQRNLLEFSADEKDDDDDDDENGVEFGTIKDVLRRIRMISPISSQKQVFEQIIKRRSEIVQVYPAEPNVLSGDWKIEKIEVLDPENGVYPELRKLTVSSKRQSKPVTSDRIKKMLLLNKSESNIETFYPLLNAVETAAIEEMAVKSGYANAMVAMADADKSNAVIRFSENLKTLKNLILTVKAKTIIKVPHEGGEPKNAFVIAVRCRSRKKITNPRAYEVEFIMPGDDAVRLMSFERFVKEPNLYGPAKINAKLDAIYEQFDNAVARDETVTRVILSGDPISEVLAAYALGGGTRTSYRQIQGNQSVWSYGVLVPKYLEGEVKRIPVRVPSAQRAYDYLTRSGRRIVTNAADFDQGFSISCIKSIRNDDQNDRLTIHWSENISKYAKMLIVEMFSELSIRDVYRTQEDEMVVIGKQNILKFLNHLIENDTPFFGSPEERNFFLGITDEIQNPSKKVTDVQINNQGRAGRRQAMASVLS